MQSDIKTRTYQFSLNIIRLLAKLDKKNWSMEVIGKQLLRSATSIGANVIEAQAGSSRKDFTNFYRHALKSANESCYWLQLLHDTWDEQKDAIDRLLRECTELCKILGSSVIKLKEN